MKWPWGMAANILIRVWNINFLTRIINSIARMMNWIQFIFMCHLLSRFLHMWNSINSILWRGMSNSRVSPWVDLLFLSKDKMMFPALASILHWHLLLIARGRESATKEAKQCSPGDGKSRGRHLGIILSSQKAGSGLHMQASAVWTTGEILVEKQSSYFLVFKRLSDQRGNVKRSGLFVMSTLWTQQHSAILQSLIKNSL